MPSKNSEVATVEFSKEELEDFAQKCLDFTEVFCATEFYEYQREFAKAILIDIIGGRSNSLTGLFARQSGKSETMANTSAALMILLPKLASLKSDEGYIYPQLSKFRKGLWVGIFTPSENQSETTFKRLKGKLDNVNTRVFFENPEFAAEGEKEIKWISKTQRYLELNNGSQCLMMSANKQANIESKTYHLILLDESQDLEEFVVNKSIIPMGTQTNATMIATGTPGTTKGFFYNKIGFNKTEQSKFGMQQLHFQYDYTVCQKYNSNYRKFIDKQKRSMGVDSDEFRMAYKLEWLLERGMAITQELFDELTDKSRTPSTSFADKELIAGLDFGKSSDSTVLTIGIPLYDERDESGRCPVKVIYWWSKVGDDYEAIFTELKDELARFSVRSLACDYTGVGEPLTDRLTWELPTVTVIPVKFTAQSKDHLYKNFLLMLQEKMVAWPGHASYRKTKRWKQFEHQMIDLQKEYKSGYLSCHAPDDQREAHDDFPDSLALMLWCVHEEAMPYIETSSQNKLYQGIDWRQQKPKGNVPFSLR